ncbi:MAG: PQQ-binding-like beta-propeller repeat protein [Verrucomicrobiota bacterium]
MRWFFFTAVVSLMACSSEKAPRGEVEAVEAVEEKVESDWLVFRGNAHLSGVSPETLAAPLELAWSKQLGGERRVAVLASAVIADGKVFVGATNGVFYCLALEDGKVLWEFDSGSDIEGTAALAGDLVCFGNLDGEVIALRAETGELIWRTSLSGEVFGGVNVAVRAEESTLFLVGCYDAYLRALDAMTGEVVWELETGDRVNGTPTILGSEVLFGGCDGFIYYADVSSGSITRKVEFDAPIANSVGAAHGLAAFGYYGNEVVGLEAETGEIRWRFGERNFPFFSCPAITEESVFVGGRDRRMYRLDAVTGEKVWEFSAGGQVDSSALLAGELVIFGTAAGKLFALDQATGQSQWSYEVGGDVTASPALSRGTLVIGTEDGTLFGFREKGD